MGLLVLLAQQPGRAQTSAPNALPFFKNYFITGDYQVGSVDLSGPAGGFATGDIHFNAALGNAVPPNADIVGAFLYWEMITLAPSRSDLSMGRVSGATTSAASRSNSGRRSFWQRRRRRAGPEVAGEVFAMRAYRADVLRFLHVPTNADGDAGR